MSGLNSDIELNQELEVLCEGCRGKGETFDCYGRQYRCAGCNGSGYQTTEFGEKILSLIRHNFTVMLEDSRN